MIGEEELARVIHAAHNSAPYPWWHIEAEHCQVSAHIARAVLAALSARAEESGSQLADGLDTLLPCDVEVAHIRFRKGVALRTFVNAARRWHASASAAAKTDPEKLAEFKAWFERKVEIEGNDPISVGVGLAGPDLCPHDGSPCYVSAGTDDAHWRCGTSACPTPPKADADHG